MMLGLLEVYFLSCIFFSHIFIRSTRYCRLRNKYFGAQPKLEKEMRYICCFSSWLRCLKWWGCWYGERQEWIIYFYLREFITYFSTTLLYLLAAVSAVPLDKHACAPPPTSLARRGNARHMKVAIVLSDYLIDIEIYDILFCRYAISRWDISAAYAYDGFRWFTASVSAGESWPRPRRKRRWWAARQSLLFRWRWLRCASAILFAFHVRNAPACRIYASLHTEMLLRREI